MKISDLRFAISDVEPGLNPIPQSANGNRKSQMPEDWTRHAFIGVIGAVTRKSSAARQALARNFYGAQKDGW